MRVTISIGVGDAIFLRNILSSIKSGRQKELEDDELDHIDKICGLLERAVADVVQN